MLYDRMKLSGVAAAAVLALSGWVRAQDIAPVAAPFEVQQSLTLDAAAADDTRTPLMRLMNLKPLEKAGINIYGRVEGSYTKSFDSPPGHIIAGRVFDQEEQDLTLNQAAIVVERVIDPAKSFDIGGRIEWIYGADSRFIHALGLFDHYGFGDGPNNQWDLNQAYLDIGFAPGWSVRAGKFVALHGFEVIDSSANPLYSHSFSFNYAIPFTHTGVLIKHKANDELDYTFGISRGWDTATEDNNDTLDYLGQIHYVSSLDKGATEIYFNVVAGAEQDNDNWRTVLNLIYIRKLGENVKLVFDGVYGYEANSATSVTHSDAQWFGGAAYAMFTLDPHVTLAARVEYFNDQDGARATLAVGGTSLMSATVGLNITPFPDDPFLKGFLIRPEVRFDYAEKAFYDGGTDHHQMTVAIDAMYRF